MERMRIMRLSRQISIRSLPLTIMEKYILWKYLIMSTDNCFYSVIVYLFLYEESEIFCIPRASCKDSIFVIVQTVM